MTAPRTLADDLDHRQTTEASKMTGLPTSAPSTVPDSVPVALLGDDKSPEARHQYMARIAEIAHALIHGGPQAVLDSPPPKPQIMRATTPKERGGKS